MKLVIGYGNTLRGDDGIGQYIANQIDAQGWPTVRALALTQLLPELAADIANADSVIFVDADMGVTDVCSSALVPDAHMDSSAILAHHAHPAGLLTLAHVLYGRCPSATLIHVPAHHVDLCDGLSAEAQRMVPVALAAIKAQLDLAFT